MDKIKVILDIIKDGFVDLIKWYQNLEEDAVFLILWIPGLFMVFNYSLYLWFFILLFIIGLKYKFKNLGGMIFIISAVLVMDILAVSAYSNYFYEANDIKTKEVVLFKNPSLVLGKDNIYVTDGNKSKIIKESDYVIFKTRKCDAISYEKIVYKNTKHWLVKERNTLEIKCIKE